MGGEDRLTNRCPERHAGTRRQRRPRPRPLRLHLQRGRVLPAERAGATFFVDEF